MLNQDLVLIPFGNEILAITREEYKRALELGRQLTPQSPAVKALATETLVDAEGMSSLTNPPIPASWFLEKARRKEIPFVPFGKYVRFRPSDVFKALEKGIGHKARLAPA